MIHNIPMRYTTKGLFNGEVLKFDIKRPTKDEQLWNKQTEKTRNCTQECIIESHSEINNAKQSKTNEEEQNKTQRKRNSDQINKQDSKEKRPKTNQKRETRAQKLKRGEGEKAKTEKTKQQKQAETKQNKNEKQNGSVLHQKHTKKGQTLSVQKMGMRSQKRQQNQDKESRSRCPKIKQKH